MKTQQFFIQLIGLTLLLSGIIKLLNLTPLFDQYQVLAWSSIFLFFVISIVMFFSGRWGAKHPNKSRFIGLMYLFMGGKMLLSILLIFSYHQMVQPDSKLFILPFFLVYFTYTIFESYFLIKLNKQY